MPNDLNIISKKIILYDLPKFSLNNWYSGNHWTFRKNMKDKYIIIVKNQFKHVFSKFKKYNVSYTFNFNKNSLDATNCVGMAKLIEDIIFENDKYDIILSVKIKSRKIKDKSNVEIIIDEII